MPCLHNNGRTTVNIENQAAEDIKSIIGVV